MQQPKQNELQLKKKAQPVSTQQPGYEPTEADMRKAYATPKMSTESDM